jgi:hypothetical protein
MPFPLTSSSQRILRAKEAQDSIGGTITCVIRNAPPGLGEPVFDKFEAALAHAMLSIPATKAFEIGSGFRGTEVPGSQHNDPFVRGESGRLRTATNWSGGIQGGITNGESIYFRYGHLIPFLLPCRHVHESAPGLVSNHLPPSLKLRRRRSTMELQVLWLQEVAMILVLCLVRFLLWKPWLLSSSWTSFSYRIRGRQLPVFFLLLPRYQQPWSCLSEKS